MELNTLESETLIEFYNTAMLPEIPFEIEICKLIEEDNLKRRKEKVSTYLPIILVDKLKAYAGKFSIYPDKLIHDAIKEYLINHNNNQNIKDVEDLIFGDDDLNGIDEIQIVSQR